MSAFFVTQGRQSILADYLSAQSANIRCGLYKARAVYGITAVIGDITACDFSGYAAQTPAWVSFGINANDNSDFAAPAMSFTHNGGGTSNTVLGYYLYNSNTNKLLFMEDFGAPTTLSANGQFVSVKPDIYCGLLPPPL